MPLVLTKTNLSSVTVVTADGGNETLSVEELEVPVATPTTETAQIATNDSFLVVEVTSRVYNGVAPGLAPGGACIAQFNGYNFGPAEDIDIIACTAHDAESVTIFFRVRAAVAAQDFAMQLIYAFTGPPS